MATSTLIRYKAILVDLDIESDTYFTLIKALKYFYINKEIKGFFQFEIIINVLVSSFRFI